MRLFDFNFVYLDKLDPVFTLKSLYDVTGNCPESGYLEDEFVESGYNDKHDFEFETFHRGKSMDVKSVGVASVNGVTLKQVRTMGDVSTKYLYSWDTLNNEYSFVVFADESALDSAFDYVTSNETNLCYTDIDEYFKESGLPVSSILDIGYRQQLDPFLHMMDDYEKKEVVKK